MGQSISLNFRTAANYVWLKSNFANGGHKDSVLKYVDPIGQREVNRGLNEALAGLELSLTDNLVLKKIRLESFIAMDLADGKTKLYVLADGDYYAEEIHAVRRDSRYCWLLENALIEKRAEGYNIWRVDSKPLKMQVS